MSRITSIEPVRISTDHEIDGRIRTSEREADLLHLADGDRIAYYTAPDSRFQPVPGQTSPAP